MNRTTSLTNPPVQTPTPGTHFMPCYMEYCQTQPDLCICLQLRLQSRHIHCHRICHKHAATLRACPLPHIICCREPHHQNQKFCTIQRFRLDLTQGFQRYSTQVFPTQSDSRFLMIFDSGFSDSFRPRVLTGFESVFWI